MCVQELLVAEKGALEMRLSTSEASLQEHQQQLSELTQKHTAIQAELTDSLEYQQQIEAQLNELEMEAQAAKASYEAEQGQSQKLTEELSQTQAELSRVENALAHTNTALTQTSELTKELQVYTCFFQTALHEACITKFLTCCKTPEEFAATPPQAYGQHASSLFGVFPFCKFCSLAFETGMLRDLFGHWPVSLTPLQICSASDVSSKPGISLSQYSALGSHGSCRNSTAAS